MDVLFFYFVIMLVAGIFSFFVKDRPEYPIISVYENSEKIFDKDTVIWLK